VTAIANGLQRPERLVGMHFFNPVPLMKLVEVVSGLRTDAAAAEAVFALSKAWGKVPVHAKSTPGFIVNRIARPYYAETLARLQEQAAPPEVLDACLRAAGFRMGPCELMDLIGHDTNFAVTNSVYAANFFDKRYQPSGVQQAMVDGGLLGRKSGRGFYAYPGGAPALPPVAVSALPVGVPVVVHGDGPLAETLAARLTVPTTRDTTSGWTGLAVGEAQLRLTDGRSAGELAQSLGRRDIAVFDRLPGNPAGWHGALAMAFADAAGTPWRAEAAGWLAALGVEPQLMADTPGLVVARTLAMLINEAADAVQQGVCSPDGADAAMKLGVNYPAGPFEWLAGWSADGVLAVLSALDTLYRGERYRASPWLHRRAQRDALTGA
jgi:3-hydroxybutyryl-CoA dehydrogenase